MVEITGQSGLKEPALQMGVPSAEDMESLGGKLARHCPSGSRIYVQGPLGAGKTTLVRGFLRAEGYTGTVKSPTYTLLEPYILDKKIIYHFDFYRISETSELETIGVRDYFDGSAICLVEWPEHAGSILEAPDLHILISMAGTGRRVSIEAGTPLGESIIHTLK